MEGRDPQEDDELPGDFFPPETRPHGPFFLTPNPILGVGAGGSERYKLVNLSHRNMFEVDVGLVEHIYRQS